LRHQPSRSKPSPFGKWKKPILQHEWDHAGTFEKLTDIVATAEQIKGAATESSAQPAGSETAASKAIKRPFVQDPNVRNKIAWFYRG
jgi:hypothetical protein